MKSSNIRLTIAALSLVLSVGAFAAGNPHGVVPASATMRQTSTMQTRQASTTQAPAAAQPDLRQRNRAEHPGQRGLGAGLGVQSRWRFRNEIRGRATAELAQSEQRLAVRRRLLASALTGYRQPAGWQDVRSSFVAAINRPAASP
jgi:hypothetical protein